MQRRQLSDGVQMEETKHEVRKQRYEVQKESGAGGESGQGEVGLGLAVKLPSCFAKPLLTLSK